MKAELNLEKANKVLEKLEIVKIDINLLKEALFVAKYESILQSGSQNNFQLKEADEPNRKLANVGDRVLKLVLTQYQYENIDSDLEQINNFTNDNERNSKLGSLGLITAHDGYCDENGELKENRKSAPVILATMIEGIIGALYLSEYNETGTFYIARDFIIEKIVKRPPCIN